MLQTSQLFRCHNESSTVRAACGALRDGHERYRGSALRDLIEHHDRAREVSRGVTTAGLAHCTANHEPAGRASVLAAEYN